MKKSQRRHVEKGFSAWLRKNDMTEEQARQKLALLRSSADCCDSHRYKTVWDLNLKHWIERIDYAREAAPDKT